ncbi:MAG: DNA repair protein RadA [Planctomycetota bacterium]|nr:MAG: DNA repair protein RadA [Planctomycetota bacterium]HIC22357.1 DNA repair protein RadA [Planctomycetota bacterium]
MTEDIAERTRSRAVLWMRCSPGFRIVENPSPSRQRDLTVVTGGILAKSRFIFMCLECGTSHERHMGRCPDCGTFNSLKEHRLGTASSEPTPRLAGESATAVSITQIEAREEDRMAIGMGEVDRVLGGGLVPGCGILLSGEPGVGKSTLLLQIAQAISSTGNRFLYITGEESAAQVRLRADRIGASSEELWLLPECDVEAIEQQILSIRPAVVGIDSIQTIRWEQIPAGAGGVVQVREVTSRLLALARREGIPMLMVGHVTKDGGVAGPRALEHMVDAVLQFEGERGHALRVLRGLKNRFGSTEEVGIFEMRSDGLIEVENPSGLLLGDRRHSSPGSAAAAVLEGSRPLLLEIQALVTPAAHGAPARKVSGIDSGRLSMLAAVLEKRLGIPLGGCDIHANAVGGVKLRGTAGDLALAAAILSSFHDRALPRDVIFAGEVGLLGEIRPVPGTRQRLEEAKRLGFQAACLAPGSLEGLPLDGMRIHETQELADLAKRFVE